MRVGTDYAEKRNETVEDRARTQGAEQAADASARRLGSAWRLERFRRPFRVAQLDRKGLRRGRARASGWALGGALLAAAMLLSTSPARAASSTSNNGTVVLDTLSISRVQPYRQSRRWWVNYEECKANDVFSFPLQLRDTSNTVEVWAGNVDCAANRGNTDMGQCWILATEPRPEDTLTIDVPVRNIVARRLGGVTPPSNLDDSVCDASTDPSGEQFTFYFILQDGGSSEASTKWDGGAEGTGFDMVGPSPPSSISVGIGESQLSIGIGDIDEESDRQRFEAFCVPEGTMPLPGEDAGIAAPTVVADAGDAGDTGAAVVAPTAAEGTPAPPACFTPIIRGGVRPPIGFSCGEAGEVSTTLKTSRLQNGITYAVGVAGQDAVENAGVLSEIECGTPTELDDFYELYSRNGGLGGGGFCSLPRVPRAPSRVPLLAAGGLLALLAGRRVRSSR